MPILSLAICLIFLLILMVRFKINAFIALLLSAFLVGLLNMMSPATILKSITTGIGQTMGDLILILTFGAMLGKILEASGAAHRITHTIVDALGESRISYAVLIAGFIIGMPMMYNASFLVLIPIIYSFSTVSRIPLIKIGIPLAASLSIAHGYLPPHPAPIVISQMFNADVNAVFLYGLIVSVPAIILAGVFFPKLFGHVTASVPSQLFANHAFDREHAPSFAASLFCATLPFVLMIGAALLKNVGIEFIAFVGDPNVALFIAVLVALVILGVGHGRAIESLMKELGAAVNSIAMIILIIAAGGGFKAVLTDSGSSAYVQQLATEMSFHPILMAWSLAAFIRLMIGSATVAAITAAGVIAPLVQRSGVPPALMVLATGSGSLMFSHFNDVGFWMFKEYFNVSIKETFQIWTTMECLIAIIGLIGSFLLNAIL
jgi:Gnt-II system L-idonate transporter